MSCLLHCRAGGSRVIRPARNSCTGNAKPFIMHMGKDRTDIGISRKKPDG